MIIRKTYKQQKVPKKHEVNVKKTTTKMRKVSTVVNAKNEKYSNKTSIWNLRAIIAYSSSNTKSSVKHD